MKKLILFTFAMLLCIPAFSKQKIRIERVEPDSTTQEIVTYRTKANHWSISGTVGIGFLDGDQKQSFSTMFPRSAKHLNFTVNLEYTINPIWGIYLEYLYNPYGGTAPYTNQVMGHHIGPQLDFRAMNHEGSLGVSLNLLNLFVNCRKQTFNWYGNIGVGASFFKMLEHPMIIRDDEGNLTPETDPWSTLSLWERRNANGKLTDMGRSMSIITGTTLEINATRWLAILLNIQYRTHFQDTYDGAVRGNDDDNTVYGGIGLRWKINSLTHRDRYHVRDMALCAWSPSSGEKLAKKSEQKLDSLEKRLAALEHRVDTIENRLDSLEPRVTALEDAVADLMRDTDGDGVPDFMDREPNTPRNTPVNEYGQAVGAPGSGSEVRPGAIATGLSPVYADNNKGKAPAGGAGTAGKTGVAGKDGKDGKDGTVNFKMSMDTEGLSIYFATAKYDISPVSHYILATVARRLHSFPEYKVAIRGYADQQGERTNYANQKLSDNRAKKVRDTLMRMYGIPADRIIEMQGHGAIEGPTIDYLPNRRVDMIFVK